MIITNKLTTLVNDLNALWAPPVHYSLQQWSERYMSISNDSADAGAFFALPFQREILTSMTDPADEIVVVRKSARVGYTTMCLFLVGYHISQQPAAIMFVQPTISDAQSFSKNEFNNLINDNDILHKIFSEIGKDTMLEKSFPGGRLMFVGSNSPAGFRRVSIRILILDEINGYPASAGAEGCPIKLATKRTESFHNRKIVMGSTPTNTSSSKITQNFELSDQRFFEIPCPSCSAYQALEWPNFKWQRGKPDTVIYECTSCQHAIKHHQKFEMIDKGKWVPRNPDSKIKGYHIWTAYSYLKNASWSHLVDEFEKAEGNWLLEKVFTNTWLGEDFNDEPGHVTDYDKYRADNAENYRLDVVPKNCKWLLSGVDIQADKIVCVTLAINKLHIYIIGYQEFFGDTLDVSKDGPWDALEKYRVKAWQSEDGKTFKINLMAVDTGGNTTTKIAYDWTSKRKGVLAIKGSSMHSRDIITSPSKIKYQYGNSKSKKVLQLYNIGVHKLKLMLFKILTEDTKTENSHQFHFSSDLPDRFFRELFSEKLVSEIKKNGSVHQYFKKMRQYNEVLDCVVYAMFCYLISDAEKK